MSKYVAFFFLGTSCGGAMMLLLLGNQIEELYTELHRRQNELVKMKEELETLQEQLSDEQKEEVIQGIDLQLLEQKGQQLNKVTKEIIIAETYQWLKQMNIIGEPVKVYAELPQFFRETINQHKIKVEQQEYQLIFDSVAIGTRIRIWFSVKKVVDDVAIW